MTDLKMRAGYVKWRGERVISYIQRAASFVVLAASSKILEIPLWWWLTLPLVFVVLWWLDKEWLYPGEADAALRENPEWRKRMGE